MDYHAHYNCLVAKAKNRTLDGYFENHHVIPRCLGGDDHENNIIKLTPEEHYVAHQLLVKMYPESEKLVHAAHMMTVKGNGQTRNNKEYGWLKRRRSGVLSKQSSGENNSQYGTCWVFHPEKNENKKIQKTQLHLFIKEGWIKGRNLGNKRKHKCHICQIEFTPKQNERICSKSCKEQSKKIASYHGREEEFLTLYKSGLSMNKALKEMGYPGAISNWYRWAKKTIDAS